jgi:hypothetical protein
MQDVADEARSMVGEMADGVAGAAGSLVAALPGAAASTKAAVDDAARWIEGESDEMLTMGATFSLGLAVGLLVGGASRLLVAASLVPVAAMGFALLDRSSRTRRPTRSTT